MKKQLLLGSALFAAISVFPQNGSSKAKMVGIKNMADEIAAKFAIEPTNAAPTTLKQVPGPILNPVGGEEQSSVAMPPSTINWQLITGSMNIYGMLVSSTRPLQYNDNLNTVSYIHRKSATYQSTPALPSNAQSGVIVAEITSNWGTSWDSTCIWSDATNWGRYPQGGIYNPPGNTTVSNAYIVGTGPTVAGSGFSGNFYASKKLNAFNTTADATPNAMQFMPFAQTGSVTNNGWSRNGFTSTDDGFVRTIGLLQPDNTTLAKLRGYAIVKGAFNGGVMVWSSDTIIPPAIIDGAGDAAIGYEPLMAWNEAGTVGYFVTLGTLATATNSTKGNQPIVYKTTNSGGSWALLTGIDFNNAANAPLLKHISPTNANTNIAVPYFTDMNVTVDATNKLHIGGIFASASSTHNDSLNYIGQFDNQGQTYLWPHVPGQRPYLVDFIGDGTSAWTHVTVDSISSERAGRASGDNGFNSNPWDPTGTSGSKTDNVDTRLMMGRTPDGQYITFAWAESDTNFTSNPNGNKYNGIPNIKTRCMAVGSGTNMYQVSATEINTTKVAAGTGTPNSSVSNRATMHYMSPTTGSAAVVSTTASTTVDIRTPIVVTNSNPFSQLTNNTTWFQNGKLSYVFAGSTTTVNGVAENLQNSASNSVIFPNPASNNATLGIDLKNNSNVDVTVLNTIGQVVKTTKAPGQVGQNNINIDLSGLSTGIYMVNIKVGNATSTKKIVVQ
ncbi:MAG: T9SS type A sorting domain-containing protein [Bacteroidetes bacterium]|nr:T9SS type A sorting domain-containing protein [Bacteroidota bacterium]